MRARCLYHLRTTNPAYAIVCETIGANIKGWKEREEKKKGLEIVYLAVYRKTNFVLVYIFNSRSQFYNYCKLVHFFFLLFHLWYKRKGFIFVFVFCFFRFIPSFSLAIWLAIARCRFLRTPSYVRITLVYVSRTLCDGKVSGWKKTPRYNCEF